MPEYLQAHCPDCNALTLRLEWRLKTKKLGTHSLAGHQLKVAAVDTPFLVCDACGLEMEGKR